MNIYENGVKRMGEILGGNADALIKHFEGISEEYAKYLAEVAYADLYNREGLSDKTLELIAVSSLITQGATFALKAHLKAMLHVGWTQKEIIQIIIFLITYVGFPKTVDAINMAKEVFAEQA
jgi:4-carboxymuconolactone decarboxylase